MIAGRSAAKRAGASVVSRGESRGHGRTVENDAVAAALGEAAAAWSARHDAGELRDALLAIVGRLPEPS